MNGADPGRIAAFRSAYEQGGLRRLDELRRDEMLALIKEGRFVSATSLGAALLQLGARRDSLDWLERAFEERDPQLIMLRTFPLWKSLHAEPRYTALCRRVGLPV